MACKHCVHFQTKDKTIDEPKLGVSMSYQLFKVQQYMQGLINYFGTANAYYELLKAEHRDKMKTTYILLKSFFRGLT